MGHLPSLDPECPPWDLKKYIDRSSCGPLTFPNSTLPPLPECLDDTLATSYRCNKKDHFNTQCLTKAAAKQELQLDAAFLGPMKTGSMPAWTVSLQTEDQDLVGQDKDQDKDQDPVFKLDMSAEVTAITEEDSLQLRGMTLRKATRVLYRPTCQTLQGLGQLQATTTSNGIFS